MSADNWAKCPACGAGGEDAEGYGLREDYEIGIWEGEFFASYQGKCRDCGFTKVFEHNEKIVTKRQSDDNAGKAKNNSA